MGPLQPGIRREQNQASHRTVNRVLTAVLIGAAGYFTCNYNLLQNYLKQTFTRFVFPFKATIPIHTCAISEVTKCANV